MPVGVARADSGGQLEIVALNPPLRHLLGVGAGEAVDSVSLTPELRQALCAAGTIALADGVHRCVRTPLPPTFGAGLTVVTLAPCADDMLAETLDRQSEMISRWRPDGTITYCNQAFAHQCGRDRGEVIGASLLALTPSAELGQILANLRRLTPTAPSAGYDHRLVTPEGDERWQEWIDRGSFDRAGRLVEILSVGRDITARKLTERRLAESQQRLQLALEAGGFGVWESDVLAGKVSFDASLLARHGWPAERRRFDLGDIRAMIHPRDRRRVDAAFKTLRTGTCSQLRLEYRIRQADGSYAWIEEHAQVVQRGPDGRPARLVGVSADISARKEAEIRLAHLALHDPLTGLPNRRALADALDRAIARAERSGTALAVLALDLDGFKAINDRFGHPMGDMALVEIGNRLRRVVRRSDFVARMGGDEFAVLAGDLKGPNPVVRLARRIRLALTETLALPGAKARVGVSIGVAFFPGDAEHPDLLLGRADLALYAAKREGVGLRLSADLTEVAASTTG